MLKTIFYFLLLLLPFSKLMAKVSIDKNNSIEYNVVTSVKNDTLNKESNSKTPEDYYKEAEEHKKNAQFYYKRGTIFFIIGISAFIISSYFRKKRNKEKNT